VASFRRERVKNVFGVVGGKAREVDECLNRFGGGGEGIWRLCYIGKRHLFTRV
jgi:hypothetical protein